MVMDHERDLETEGLMAMGNDGREDRTEREGLSLSLSLRDPLLVKNNRMNTTSQLAIVGANVCPIESLDYEYLILVLPLFHVSNDIFINFHRFVFQCSCTTRAAICRFMIHIHQIVIIFMID